MTPTSAWSSSSPSGTSTAKPWLCRQPPPMVQLSQWTTFFYAGNHSEESSSSASSWGWSGPAHVYLKRVLQSCYDRLKLRRLAQSWVKSRDCADSQDNRIPREALLRAMAVYSPTEKASSCRDILETTHAMLAAALALCRTKSKEAEGVTWACFIIEHTPMARFLLRILLTPETTS